MGLVIEKGLKMTLLYDFYGQLLTQRQRELFEMYYNDDLSLGEIAEQLRISRQAVHDILKRSAISLERFETELGLVERHNTAKRTISGILSELKKLEAEICAKAEFSSNEDSLAAYTIERLKTLRSEVEIASKETS